MRELLVVAARFTVVSRLSRDRPVLSPKIPQNLQGSLTCVDPAEICATGDAVIYPSGVSASPSPSVPSASASASFIPSPSPSFVPSRSATRTVTASVTSAPTSQPCVLSTVNTTSTCEGAVCSTEGVQIQYVVATC